MASGTQQSEQPLFWQSMGDLSPAGGMASVIVDGATPYVAALKALSSLSSLWQPVGGHLPCRDGGVIVDGATP